MPPTHTPNGTIIGTYTPRNYDGYNGVELLRRALRGQSMSDDLPNDFRNITYGIAFSSAPQPLGFWSAVNEQYTNDHTLSDDARMILQVWLGEWVEPTPPMPAGMTREVAQAALNAANNTIYYNDIMPAVQGWADHSFEGWPEADRATLQAERGASGRTARNAPSNIGERTRALLTAWANAPAPVVLPEGMTQEIARAALDALNHPDPSNMRVWDVLLRWPMWSAHYHANPDPGDWSGFSALPDAERVAVGEAYDSIARTPGGGRVAPLPAFRALLLAWAGQAPAPVAEPAPTGWVEPPWARNEETYLRDQMSAARRAERDYGADPRTWPPQYAIMYPGDESDEEKFATYDFSDAAEAARKASPQWPLIQTARRNYVRVQIIGMDPLPTPVLARVAEPLPKKRKPLKRVNVEAIKQKYPAINGATAGCSCGVCAKLRKGFEGLDPLTARTADQEKAAKDFAKNGRTFGVEIEAYIPANPLVAAARLNMHHALALKLADAGLKVHIHTQTADTWGVKGDGSLNRPNKAGDASVELASPILRGEQGLADVGKALAELNKLNAYVNKTTGLHVHVGAKDLTLEQRRNLLAQFIRYERFFDLILPASRRSNRYAASLRERASATKNKSTKAAEHAILTLNAVRSEDELARVMTWDDHHIALADARAKHGTFEFRQHSGSVNTEKVTNWIRLVLAFVEAAKDKQALPFYSRPLSDEEEMEKFFETFAIARDLRAYYRKRHAVLYANPENDD